MRKFEACKHNGFINVKLPERSTEKSAGYDIFAPLPVVIPPHGTGMVKTFVKAKMMKDDVLVVLPRSSTGIKKHLMLMNTMGIIDADYYNNPENEGNIILWFYNFGDEEVHITPGTKIAQGIFMKYKTTDDDVTTGERTGGIGSTGE